jgi:hypothetical protein
MDEAVRKLVPMCAHGFGMQQDGVVAQEWAGRLLSRLQTEGLYI